MINNHSTIDMHAADSTKIFMGFSKLPRMVDIFPEVLKYWLMNNVRSKNLWVVDEKRITNVISFKSWKNLELDT
jgi:hypothetical protein